MNKEFKNLVLECQNCKQDFTIEPDDFLFYEKIKVPPPTFCPECRLQRRLTWRNERNLYRRKCDAPGHNEFIVSIYSPDAKFPVYDSKYWNSGEWEGLDYGIDINFSEVFLCQFYKLTQTVPVPALFNLSGFNSEYCNCTYQSKNCYLNFASDMNEDTAYLYHSIENRNCFDMLGSRKNENCYELVDCEGCYGSSNLRLSDNCIDSKYCYDCRNCQDCISCCGLRNAKYHILNKKYTPEEYKNKIFELNLGTTDGNEKIESEYKELLKKYPRKFFNSKHVVDCVGDYIKDAKNCDYCFDIEGPAEDLKYVVYGVTNIKNLYDCYGIGVNVSNCYEVIANGSNVSYSKFSSYVFDTYSNYYCCQSKNCSNCFGCIGLLNKQYCILNKQYTKEEYEELVPKIIKHMNDMPYVDKKGREYKYGEFFPSELSPFDYNETISQEYFPLTKKEVIFCGYRWKDNEEKNHKIDINSDDTPSNIKDVSIDILNKIIECSHKGVCNQQCTEAFKITPEELQFYQRMNLPLPRLCPNCRHYERLSQRNPMKLWHRKCMNEGCKNEFETSYAPDLPEIVYCESCYQKEVI